MEKKGTRIQSSPNHQPQDPPALKDMDTKRTEVESATKRLVLIVVGREIPKYPTATLLQDRVHLGQRTGWPQFQIIGRNIWKLRHDNGKVPSTPPLSETCVSKKKRDVVLEKFSRFILQGTTCWFQWLEYISRLCIFPCEASSAQKTSIVFYKLDLSSSPENTT